MVSAVSDALFKIERIDVADRTGEFDYDRKSSASSRIRFARCARLHGPKHLIGEGSKDPVPPDL